MPARLPLSNIAVFVSLLGAAFASSGAPPSAAAELPWHIPAWLKAHIGDGDGQISEVVLQRARALYLEKRSAGTIKNPCYFAMDATRPAGFGRRFYIICEAQRSFRAVSSGHGNGRNIPGVANFANGIRCAKHFSNAMDSKLTTGGPYVTAEIRTSFKGYYRAGGKNAALLRSFLQFEGEGDTANARDRAIGGHPALVLRAHCRWKDPKSAYADEEGYVPFGTLVNYSGGRSNGCTTWTPADAEKILAIVRDQPTTLYIYPESGDIAAVAQAVKAGRSLSSAGLYWNASCLREIGSPRFWPKEELEPILAKYLKKDEGAPPRPLPLCKGSP